MKNIVGYVLVIFGLSFISCERDEDIAPLSIVGTWEHVTLNHTQELDSVLTLTYTADGDYTSISTLKNIGQQEILGYNFIASGTYRVEGNELIFIFMEQLNIPKDGEKQFFAKEELVVSPLVDGLIVQGSTAFEISKQRTGVIFTRRSYSRKFRHSRYGL